VTAQDVRDLMDRCHDVLTMAEPSPAGQSLDGGSSRDRLPINPRLTDAKADLHACLTSWARMVAEEKPTRIDCDDNPTSIAAWIWGHADWLAAHPAADDLHHEITDCLTHILHSIDRGDDRIFLGIHAGEAIYARPGQKTVVLPDGSVPTVEEMRGWMRRKTLDVQGTAREVAIILQEVHRMTWVKPQRIIACYREDRKAREKGHLGRHEGLDHVAMDGKQPVFVVDEVLTRLAKDTARAA